MIEYVTSSNVALPLLAAAVFTVAMAALLLTLGRRP